MKIFPPAQALCRLLPGKLALRTIFRTLARANEPYSSPTLRLSLRFSRLRLFLSHFQRMRPFFFHFLGLDPNKSPNEYFSSSVALLLTNTYKKASNRRLRRAQSRHFFL